jgi:hypothetical protein
VLAPRMSEERKETPMEILFCGLGPEAHPGNPEKWKEFLIMNLTLDDASFDTICAGTYRVMVQLVSRSSGQLDDIKIIMDPGYGLGSKMYCRDIKKEGNLLSSMAVHQFLITSCR